VIKEVRKCNNNFRVLALSATPGTTQVQIQNVIQNLLISHLEVRTEGSIDIQKYVHGRETEKLIVPLSVEEGKLLKKLLDNTKVIVDRLKQRRAMYAETALEKLTSFKLISMRDTNRKVAKNPAVAALSESDFAMAISLYRCADLLQTHGVTSCYAGLEKFVEEGNSAPKKIFANTYAFKDLMMLMKAEAQNPDWTRRPKMVKLKEILEAHFKKGATDTRVMIFSHYRDSVREICDFLETLAPLIRPSPFVGQASSGQDEKAKGMNQGKQLEVIREFKAGTFNTLVCTSIGEEGLDIGEIDLIVCFDTQTSPTRMLQRMGRTGRKRQGRIVMLVTEGKEQEQLRTSQQKLKNVQKIIASGKFAYYPYNARLIPQQFRPKYKAVQIEIPPAPVVVAKKRRVTKAERAAVPEPPNPMGYLTAAEREEYEAEYGDQLEDEPPQVALDEFVDWFPRPSPVHRIQHSKRSLDFADLATTLELLAGQEGDVYGEATKAYLLPGDVVIRDPAEERALLKQSRSVAKKKAPETYFAGSDEEDFKGPPPATTSTAAPTLKPKPKPKQAGEAEQPAKRAERTSSLVYPLQESDEDSDELPESRDLIGLSKAKTAVVSSTVRKISEEVSVKGRASPTPAAEKSHSRALPFKGDPDTRDTWMAAAPPLTASSTAEPPRPRKRFLQDDEDGNMARVVGEGGEFDPLEYFNSLLTTKPSGPVLPQWKPPFASFLGSPASRGSQAATQSPTCLSLPSPPPSPEKKDSAPAVAASAVEMQAERPTYTRRSSALNETPPPEPMEHIPPAASFPPPPPAPKPLLTPKAVPSAVAQVTPRPPPKATASVFTPAATPSTPQPKLLATLPNPKQAATPQTIAPKSALERTPASLEQVPAPPPLKQEESDSEDYGLDDLDDDEFADLDFDLDDRDFEMVATPPLEVPPQVPKPSAPSSKPLVPPHESLPTMTPLAPFTSTLSSRAAPLSSVSQAVKTAAVPSLSTSAPKATPVVPLHLKPTTLPPVVPLHPKPSSKPAVAVTTTTTKPLAPVFLQKTVSPVSVSRQQPATAKPVSPPPSVPAPLAILLPPQPPRAILTKPTADGTKPSAKPSLQLSKRPAGAMKIKQQEKISLPSEKAPHSPITKPAKADKVCLCDFFVLSSSSHSPLCAAL